jgi:predicted Zn-dependent protease
MTAVKHKPRDAKYRLTLANVLMRAQKAQEAIGHLQSVIRFQPDNTAAWGMLGTVYLGLGNELQAVKSFRGNRPAPTGFSAGPR